MTEEGPVNLELDPARSECLTEGCDRPQCMSPVRVAIVRFQEARVHRRAGGRGVAELVGYESSQLPRTSEASSSLRSGLLLMRAAAASGPRASSSHTTS